MNLIQIHHMKFSKNKDLTLLKRERQIDGILHHIKKAMPSRNCNEELPLSALLVLFGHHGFYLREM